MQRGAWHGQGQKGLFLLPSDIPAVSAGPQPGPPTFALLLSSSTSAPLSSSDTSGASSPGPSSVSSSRPIFFPFSRILCFSSYGVEDGELDTLGLPISSMGLAVHRSPASLGPAPPSAFSTQEGMGLGGLCPAVRLCRAWGDNLGDSFGTSVNMRTQCPKGPQVLQWRRTMLGQGWPFL